MFLAWHVFRSKVGFLPAVPEAAVVAVAGKAAVLKAAIAEPGFLKAPAFEPAFPEAAADTVAAVAVLLPAVCEALVEHSLTH